MTVSIQTYRYFTDLTINFRVSHLGGEVRFWSVNMLGM